MKGKMFDISLKRDADALIVGALGLFVLAVLPIPGDPVGKAIATVRDMVAGRKA